MFRVSCCCLCVGRVVADLTGVLITVHPSGNFSQEGNFYRGIRSSGS
jgi:hypothetical protein